MPDNLVLAATRDGTIHVSVQDRGRWTSAAAFGIGTFAIGTDSSAGALLGGLVVDAAAVSSLRMPAVACCGAGLLLHEILTREVKP